MAGAGIIIPVIIHLWNIRKGKVLQVGSTMLMADATRQTSSSLRLSQWLLLVLRCLLIICLAMLLAGPEWRNHKPQQAKGWILLDKNDIGFLYKRFKSTIDSLSAQGFEIHTADKRLEKIDLTESLDRDTSAFGAFSENMAKPTSPRLSYWSVISKADRILPAGYPVYFFSNDRAADATGTPAVSRPVISLDLRWQVVSMDTLVAPVPVKARQIADGNYRLSSIQPGDNGSYFIHKTVSNPPAEYKSPDTNTLRIILYQRNYPEDLRYLQAAIRAIASFGQYKIATQTVEDPKRISGTHDWIFWLSDEALPGSLPVQNVFRYGPGKPSLTKTWAVSNDGPIESGTVAIYQHTTADINNNKTIWKDGFGNPVLALQQQEGQVPKRIYHFYSRFDPGWSDMAWNQAFPKLLLPLITNSDATGALQTGNDLLYRYAKTKVANLIPTVLQDTYKENKSAVANVDLSRVLWLIAFILFSAERLLSMNNKSANRK